jgi:hypothetical protein
MRRRDFLISAGALAAAAAAAGIASQRAFAADAPTPGSAPAPGETRLFEWRTYHFASPEKQRAFAKFLAEAAVPAWNRAGVKPVGLFTQRAADNNDLKLTADPTDLYVFLAYGSPAAAVEIEPKLAADAEFQSAGKDILTAPKSDAPFTRYESVLLRATPGRPAVKLPDSGSAAQLLELRVYESHTMERHLNKLAMFAAGEFEVFDRCGMPVLFFGSALAGPDLPQLTYMIAHRDMPDREAHWKAFGSDPTWKQLRSDPQYKDNTSRTTARFYRPLPGSQIGG